MATAATSATPRPPEQDAGSGSLRIRHRLGGVAGDVVRARRLCSWTAGSDSVL